jgi:stearoyl-CoA desaturase (Delta-9 desaturase)
MRRAAIITSALGSGRLSVLQERPTETQLRTADVLANLRLPHLPTRQEILARAIIMYARTPSMEAIVDRAHALILEAISARLHPAGLPAR